MERIPKGMCFLTLNCFALLKSVHRKPGGIKGLSNELMQLRKICQHPFLFESVEDKLNPGGLIDDKLIRTSGKIDHWQPLCFLRVKTPSKCKVVGGEQQ